MNVFATPFKGTAPNASVLLGIEVSGRDLKLETGERIALSYYAINTKGKYSAGSTDTITKASGSGRNLRDKEMVPEMKKQELLEQEQQR